MRKCIHKNKWWISVIIYLFGLYTCVMNLILLSTFALLIINSAVSLKEYILSLIYVLADSAVYVMIYKYFLQQKVYEYRVSKSNIILKTYYKEYIFAKNAVCQQNLSRFSLKKLTYRLKIKDGAKNRVFYVGNKLL